jgi:hypothetical protein
MRRNGTRLATARFKSIRVLEPGQAVLEHVWAPAAGLQFDEVSQAARTAVKN